MKDVKQEQVTTALLELGLAPGDGLLVHSAVQFLGRPQGGLEIYLQALLETIAPGGTLAVPAFNFAFARGEPYDPLSTPSQGMGALSELVRQHSNAQRTPHPMQSLAVIGAHAADLAGRDTPCAFDAGSAFERMLELDFKLLLLGADVQAVSMVHYSEQRFNVSYRYWKEFSGQVKTSAGWQMCTYKMFVRDLKIDPQLDLHPIQGLLEQRSQWRCARLNYGSISTCRLRDFVAAADTLLTQDAWALVGK
jgi:aminoglycoside 3-N-acetyltransferase